MMSGARASRLDNYPLAERVQQYYYVAPGVTNVCIRPTLTVPPHFWQIMTVHHITFSLQGAGHVITNG
jgi:hypothetical protein